MRLFRGRSQKVASRTRRGVTPAHVALAAVLLALLELPEPDLTRAVGYREEGFGSQDVQDQLGQCTNASTALWGRRCVLVRAKHG